MGCCLSTGCDLNMLELLGMFDALLNRVEDLEALARSLRSAEDLGVLRACGARTGSSSSSSSSSSVATGVGIAGGAYASSLRRLFGIVFPSIVTAAARSRICWWYVLDAGEEEGRGLNARRV